MMDIGAFVSNVLIAGDNGLIMLLATIIFCFVIWYEIKGCKP